jgi:uncharacterized membrane protein YjdF
MVGEDTVQSTANASGKRGSIWAMLLRGLPRFPHVVGVGLLVSIPFLAAVDEDWLRVVIAAICAVSIWLLQWALGAMQRRHILSHRDSIAMLNIWAFVLVGNGFGSLGLYDRFFYYDMFLHFVFPFLAAEFFFIAFNSTAINRQQTLPRGIVQRTNVILLVMGVVMACVLGWEVFEYLMDVTLATEMLGQIGDRFDTEGDIAVGFLAVLLAAVLERRQWSRIFERRITPMQTDADDFVDTIEQNV